LTTETRALSAAPPSGPGWESSPRARY
jgi:hypothetical protein